ncbi:hypothetical protein LEUCIP111803_00581 [Leucobacter soli]|uniref:WYL domain-containing protein n=1 Tax=Leucobacter soli TaxID=2812850 RepID=A0A916JU24_9MICO|nr:WYL domain-containing protein [Leucobacter soli]CAG7602686.1 hypothetical protein LEUCIP111803_00581 [Leucobacter soli]
MATVESQRSRIPGERRVFSLVLALVASTQGATKHELLSTVYGYADRYRERGADEALERQFERDKEQLRALGIPLETLDSPLESGNNQLTRYRISKQLMLVPDDIRFTAKELGLLRLAALAWREGSLTAESRRSAMKLEALGAGLDVQHLGIAPRLGISEPAAAPLQRGIDERRVVEFAYQLPDRDTPMARRVAPLRLHRAEGRWHLVAFDLDRDEPRVFLLSRVIGAVRLSVEAFDEGFFAHVDPVIRKLLERRDAQRAIVRVGSGSIAEARLSARAEEPLDPAAGRAGEHELELRTLDLHELATELAGYGDEVSVIAPQELRDAVVTRLRLVRAQHDQVPIDPAAGAAPAPRPPKARAARDVRRQDVLTAPDRVVLLLSLIPYLMEHGDTPLAELARTFDIDAEALRALIEFLGTAGVPGETRTYQDEDLFDIDWEALETDDVVRLTRVVAVDDAPRFSAGERSALIVGLHSLIPLLPEAEGAHARSAAEKLAAVGGGAQAGERGEAISATADPEDERVATIASAIESRRRVAFLYRDLRGNETERIVEPLLLTQASGGWYLRGYCLARGAERNFLLDSMRELRRLAESSDREPTRGAEATVGPSETELPAVLRLRETAVPRAAAFSPRVQGEAQHGWVPAEVLLAHPATAVRLVQTAPADAIVEAPEQARRAVRDWADRALARYDA